MLKMCLPVITVVVGILNVWAFRKKNWRLAYPTALVLAALMIAKYILSFIEGGWNLLTFGTDVCVIIAWASLAYIAKIQIA